MGGWGGRFAALAAAAATVYAVAAMHRACLTDLGAGVGVGWVSHVCKADQAAWPANGEPEAGLPASAGGTCGMHHSLASHAPVCLVAFQASTNLPRLPLPAPLPPLCCTWCRPGT